MAYDPAVVDGIPGCELKFEVFGTQESLFAKNLRVIEVGDIFKIFVLYFEAACYDEEEFLSDLGVFEYDFVDFVILLVEEMDLGLDVIIVEFNFSKECDDFLLALRDL